MVRVTELCGAAFGRKIYSILFYSIRRLSRRHVQLIRDHGIAGIAKEKLGLLRASCEQLARHPRVALFLQAL